MNSNVRFCTGCGYSLNDQCAYCPNCGKLVNRQADVRPAVQLAVQPAVQPAIRPAVQPVVQPVPQPVWQPIAQPNQAVTKRRRIWPVILGVCSALILLIVIIAVLGHNPSAGLTRKIAPSDRPIEVPYQDVRIIIPGEAIDDDETLTVTPIDDLPAVVEGLEPLCPVMDIKLGKLTQFEDPILIEIPYDQQRVAGLDLEDAFVTVFFDEDMGYWKDIPHEIDESEHVVRIMTGHLTKFACYYTYYEGKMDTVYQVNQMDDFANHEIEIIYDHGNRKLTDAFERYAVSADRRPSDPKIPLFIEDVAAKTQLVWSAFDKAGIPKTKQLKIYITEETSEYATVAGNIKLGIKPLLSSFPEDRLLVSLTHELFHAAQELTIGTFDFSNTQAKNVSFWMEATAEYMAQVGVWELLEQKPFRKYQDLDLSFFRKSLYTMDKSHEYEAAAFVDYLQQTPYKVNPKTLLISGAFYSSFPETFSVLFANSDGFNLDDFYRDFHEFSLFDNRSTMQLPKNQNLMAGFTDRTDLAFKLDENNRLLPDQQLKGYASLSFGGEYTADYHMFTTDYDQTTLTIIPESDVYLYRCGRSRVNRGYDLRIESFAGTPSVIEFGKDEFILVTQMSPTKGSIGFDYLAEPAEDIAFTGRWKPVLWKFAGIEASDSFWQAVLEQKGMDKETYIASLAPSEELPPMIFDLRGDDPMKPGEVVLSLEGSDETYTFPAPQVSGNTIILNMAETNNGVHMGMLFELAAQGDQLTGQLKVDISGTVTTANGETPASAYLVIDVALEKMQSTE